VVQKFLGRGSPTRIDVAEQEVAEDGGTLERPCCTWRQRRRDDAPLTRKRLGHLSLTFAVQGSLPPLHLSPVAGIGGIGNGGEGWKSSSLQFRPLANSVTGSVRWGR